MLWLTEFGSTACHHPSKAAEILSGAFNTVPSDGFYLMNLRMKGAGLD